MHQRLKRWESPRKEGRNKKGKGGTARARQLKKQTQMMRQRLKEDNKNKQRREDDFLPAVFYGLAIKKAIASLTIDAIAFDQLVVGTSRATFGERIFSPQSSRPKFMQWKIKKLIYYSNPLLSSMGINW